MMVAAFMDILLFWTPPNVETYYFKLPRVRAIKFNPNFKDILTLTFYVNFVRSTVTLYGVAGLKLKIILETDCCSLGALKCLSWHSNGKYLLVGTDRGHIITLHYKKKFTETVVKVEKDVHENEIVDLKFSHDDAFVASIDVNGVINVLKFKTGELTVFLFLDCLYRSFLDWHPWKNLLIIGKTM